MNEKISISPVIEALETCFDRLNERFYNGELERTVITLSEGAKMRAYGWFVCAEVWHKDENKACELNISSDYLKRDFMDIMRTLAHEMVHCYNYMQGIQDCARGGSRHNKAFRDCAESHGMVWHKPETDDEKAYYKKYGYSDVRFSDEVTEEIEEMLSFAKEPLNLYRDETVKGTKKKSKTVFKYVCPCCGNSCRATKEIAIMCLDCDERMDIE